MKTGRKIIVSDFEMCPIDPIEFEYYNVPKCYGQMIVDTEAKTITFKHIAGTAPGIYHVLVAMYINKHWTKIMKDPANKKEILSGFLMFSSKGKICFMAHMGENGLPVIDGKLNYRRCFIKELTLTMSEFYNLLSYEAWLMFFYNSRKQCVRKTAKDFSFKYISPQEALTHIEPIDENEEDEDYSDVDADEYFEFNLDNYLSGYEDGICYDNYD